MEGRDLYRVLQVDPLASREIIAEAYWLLVRKAQSLRTQGQTASQALHQLNVAYTTLVNPDLRLSYNGNLPQDRLDGAPSVPGTIPDRRRPLRQRLLGQRQRHPLIGRNRRNLYRVLQVDPQAEQEIIAVAYACLRQRYIEETWSGQRTQEALDELTEAFSVLADPEQRATYDASLPDLPATRQRQEEKSTSETSPPSVADKTGTASTDSEDTANAVSRATARVAALASAVDWSGLWRKLVRFSRRLLVLAARAARYTGNRLYRGTRWLVVVVFAPMAGRLVTAGRTNVDGLLRRRQRQGPAPTTGDMDRAVRERLSLQRTSSIQVSAGTRARKETARRPAAPMARLINCGGPHSGSAFIVTDRPISLGADSQCDVILEAQGDDVAPLHARIWYREGRFMIHQIADREKGLIAGRALAWGVLEDGDELQIGRHRLTFELIPPDGDVSSASSDEENSSHRNDGTG